MIFPMASYFPSVIMPVNFLHYFWNLSEQSHIMLWLHTLLSFLAEMCQQQDP